MPTINACYADEQYHVQLSQATKPLKEFVAQELTCGDIQLQPHEISVRLLKTESDGRLTNVELEITAHAFGDRIKKTKRDMSEYPQVLMSKIDAKEVRVWLVLAELGHSWA